VSLLGELGPVWNNAWARPGYVVGGLIAQLFGNALGEETVFRGFLFLQLFLVFRSRLGERAAMLWAVVVSQVIFAVVHIPNRLLVKDTFGIDLLVDQVLVFILGVLFVLIYAGTRNLFFAVGAHALFNDPTNAVTGPNDLTKLVIVVFMLVITAVWRYASDRRSGGSSASDSTGFGKR